MVDLVRSGRNPEELSRELEPSAEAIRNWVRQADRDEGQGDGGLTTDEREEPQRRRPAASRTSPSRMRQQRPGR